MRGITEERLKEMINIGWRADYETILEECKELNTWMPIESAPKDRRILLFFIKGNCTVTGILREDIDKSNYSHWKELPEDPK